MNCKACSDAHSSLTYIAQSRGNIDYHFYDVNNKRNETRLHKLLPDFKEDKSTPVIQKCTPDGKCTITRGWGGEEEYLQ